MPKSAAQRMTPAQINQAFRDGLLVAVHTGFKRGFVESARPAAVLHTRQPRTVYRGSSDVLGRLVLDGLSVQYEDDNSFDTVTPADLLGFWPEYTAERDQVLAARDTAQAQARADAATLATFAERYDGEVATAGRPGVFFPMAAAFALENLLEGS